MMSREKNRGRPTSCAALMRISTREPAPSSCSRCLWAFSIMMMAASIIAPMAMAMPPRLMMFEPTPRAFMATNDSRIARGRVRMATSALRMCQRNTTHTRETISASSISFSCRLAMDRSMRPDRS